jgi:K+-transporting ATPase KdpF subunit
MTVALAALSGADVFGLVASLLVFGYLFYALLRGENL